MMQLHVGAGPFANCVEPRCDVAVQAREPIGQIFGALLDPDDPQLHLCRAAVQTLQPLEDFSPQLFESHHARSCGNTDAGDRRL
jgi:hypothetical protein